MESVIVKQVDALKTENFGVSPGSFNVLNIDDFKAETSPNFFEQYNRPFLDQALKRGDDVALATLPNIKSQVIDLETGKLLGNFGKELNYLVKNNYKPVNVSQMQWETIKGWFK